jgi:hypothetical protein
MGSGGLFGTPTVWTKEYSFAFQQEYSFSKHFSSFRNIPMEDGFGQGEAKSKYKAGVAKYNNTDKSKYPGFKGEVLRYFAKQVVPDEVRGLYFEHVDEDGCMLVAPSPAADLNYLRKFQDHLIPPVFGQDLLDWTAFNNSLRPRTSAWKNRQRVVYNELLEFFSGNALDVLLLRYSSETDRVVAEAAINLAAAPPALFQVAEAQIRSLNPRRLIEAADFKFGNTKKSTIDILVGRLQYGICSDDGHHGCKPDQKGEEYIEALEMGFKTLRDSLPPVERATYPQLLFSGLIQLIVLVDKARIGAVWMCDLVLFQPQ